MFCIYTMGGDHECSHRWPRADIPSIPGRRYCELCGAHQYKNSHEHIVMAKSYRVAYAKSEESLAKRMTPEANVRRGKALKKTIAGMSPDERMSRIAAWRKAGDEYKQSLAGRESSRKAMLATRETQSRDIDYNMMMRFSRRGVGNKLAACLEALDYHIELIEAGGQLPDVMGVDGLMRTSLDELKARRARVRGWMEKRK